MTLKTTRWDSAEHLQTEEDIAAYLNAVLEENNPALVTHALNVIARAKGIRGTKKTKKAKDILNIFGKVDYDQDYDYKKQR